MRESPYDIVLKPYGKALVDLARRNPDVICLGADLTRQTETDLIRDQMPERFINVGMAEANMIGIAGGLARAGKIVFVNSFGVFATRRCYDQIAMAVAYPNLNVKIVGFMPGISSPGGPSHQAIDDMALMRALPNMTVVDLADAEEITQAVGAAAEHDGPVYLRLKRGEIPVIFEPDHKFTLRSAHHLIQGPDGCVIASGMMVPAAISAVKTLAQGGLRLSLVNCPVVKPLDAATVLGAIGSKGFAMTVENHSVIGGLGTAVAEAMAEAGAGVPLLRLGLQDTFAESGSREFLFEKYRLGVQTLADAAWRKAGRAGPAPKAPPQQVIAGRYAPV
ncbi:transketolase C-terminal domain-containing protein [Pigmentiphaga soli]|uniref:Transketolase C-terminal domain-containing protein n=1 Tax=Pigmentiphaga soli TaxID=1007095 RepID=A0ABP8GZY3_9BURK